MRSAAVLASVAVLLAAPGAQAVCPNSCSGHGSCGADDVCGCYPNWQAGDCSQRTCPYDTAWSDFELDSVTTKKEAYYAECSGRGVCDRQTGDCVCEDGFEGDACQRMSCAGGANCNGHGTCVMAESSEDCADWAANKLQVCSCDPGYAGHDCKQRLCPLGDDPLSTEGVDELQTVTVTTDGTFNAGSQFVLKYTDWRGATWVTRPIDVATASVIGIKEALVSLPQRVIDDVTVVLTTDTTISKVFTVLFSGSAVPGDQPLLELMTDGCTEHGCQPYYTGVTVTGGTLTAGVVETTPGTTGRTECSTRGICDDETGICKCFSGFYGAACDKQTLVL